MWKLWKKKNIFIQKHTKGPKIEKTLEKSDFNALGIKIGKRKKGEILVLKVIRRENLSNISLAKMNKKSRPLANNATDYSISIYSVR